MATTPIAYNPSQSPIDGTEQLINLAIGIDQQDYSLSPGGVSWWNGPEESTGYVIAVPVSGNTQPTPLSLTWDPNFAGTGIVLSSGNTIATVGQIQSSVLGTRLITSPNKVMYSIRVNQLVAGEIGFGLQDMDLNSYVGGYDGKSIGFSSSGDYLYAGTQQDSGLPTWGSVNDVVDVALDLNTGIWWIRVNGGNWNGTRNEDPSSGTGSVNSAGLNNLYAAVTPTPVNIQGRVTLLSQPVYSVPSGFTFLGETNASVGFFQSVDLTENSFVELTNTVFGQNFANGTDCKTWLNDNGYWTSFVPPPVTPTPTPTPSVTPTMTPTPTITQTPTNTQTPTGTAAVTPTVTPTNTQTPTGTAAVTPTVTPTNTQTPTTTITPTPTSSGAAFVVTGGTGTIVPYTELTYLDAFSSQSGVTTTDAFDSNSGCWQLYYSHSAVTINSGSNRIGLNTYRDGTNTWTWYVTISNSNNTLGSWGTVSAVTSNQSFGYNAGGFNQSNITQTVTIPANRYFLVSNNGGPFYRTIKTLASNRTAQIGGSNYVTVCNKVALGLNIGGGTTTVPTQFGGAGTGYTFYSGASHVHSVIFGAVPVTPTPTPTITQTPSRTPTQTPTLTRTPSPTPYTTLAGSLLFNGSNQSLGISPGVTFGAGAFTLEGWFYNNSNFTTRGIIGSPLSSPIGCLNLYFANGTTITSDRNGGGGSFSYVMGSSITANQWHYLIYNRNADGTTAVYIDGVRCTATSLDTLNYTTATDTIGRYYGGYWPGYWTNMRMTIGTAVYDSTQTTQSTPRGPLTSLANTQYLMLGAVVTTDSSGTQTVTNNNGVTQTSVEPF